MPINNPTQLVDEFKKSGEFDRLRRELLKQFQKDDGIESFMARVENIARQRINADQKLKYLPPEAVHRELMQEIDRYPLVERAVADVRMLSDPGFSANIHRSVIRILRQDRGEPLDDDGAGSPEAMDIDEPSDDETPVNSLNFISRQTDVPPSLAENNDLQYTKPNSDPASAGSNALERRTSLESANVDFGSPSHVAVSEQSINTPVDGSDLRKDTSANPQDTERSSASGLNAAATPHSSVGPALQTSDSSPLVIAPIPDHTVPRDVDTTHGIQEADSV